MALTQDAVFAAADALDAKGLSPTLQAVRKAVGGGSFTSISAWMADWRAARAAGRNAKVEPLPEHLTGPVLQLGALLWAEAKTQAQAQLSAEQEAFKDDRARLEASQKEALALADMLGAEHDALQQRLIELGNALQTADARIAALTAENALVSARATTAEAKLEEGTRRADNLNEELTRVHAQNATLTTLLSEMTTHRPAPAREPPAGA